MLHTSPKPKFSSDSLYDEPFLSYGAIFGKVHRMTPNDLDMFKVKNTNIDSASSVFHEGSSSSISAVQPTGPNVPESVTDPGEEHSSSHVEDNAMDTTHQDAYSQHTEET